MYSPAVVIDNGSLYSKIGYSGNTEPSFIIPTAIASKESKGSAMTKGQYDDLDFYIGEEAYQKQKTHNLSLPVKEGEINNWDDIEKFWQKTLYSLLRVEPQDHVVLLTEPPLNPPENREQMAEIMFETFNVEGLHIGVQPVLSLFGRNSLENKTNLTALVIDSGDGVTDIIPIAHGYVISNCITHIPIAGRDITRFIQKRLKDRKLGIPAEDLMDASRNIKEMYCYLCKNINTEVAKYEDPGSDLHKVYSGVGRITGSQLNVPVGAERCLGPELFFSPEKFTKNWDRPLDQCVDAAIQSCPIDLRRDLYSNIVLSGGSTMFKNMNRRLQERIQERVNIRLGAYEQASQHSPTPIDCRISSYKTQRYGAWFGASQFAVLPEFSRVYHTRAQYSEYGPSIARTSVMFGEDI